MSENPATLSGIDDDYDCHDDDDDDEDDREKKASMIMSSMMKNYA